MSISSKIEEIRKMPENIRMRYVWGSVMVSMVFILAIWIFSFISMIKDSTKDSVSNSMDIGKQIETVKKQLPSLSDLQNESLDIPKENIVNLPSTSNEGISAEEPQSDRYSDLPSTY